MTQPTEFDPFRDQDEPPQAPTDVSDAFDPFRSTNPTVVVHDVPVEVFEQAWRDRGARCPQCRGGTAHERGTTEVDQRRWVRYTCGDVVSQEQTAG